MIVSASHRVLFVHVQKTGGLTVQAALEASLADAVPPTGLPDGRHTRLDVTLAAYPEWADYLIFGFVRNPWARMYSWHAMIMRRKAAADAGNKAVARRVANSEFWARVAADMTDFETFVMQGPEEFERLRTPQLDYLTAGERRADLIGRTERLDDDLAVVFTRLGLEPPPREQRNAGPPTDYRPHYTPRMAARVRELFAADVEAFGYEF